MPTSGPIASGSAPQGGPRRLAAIAALVGLAACVAVTATWWWGAGRITIQPGEIQESQPSVGVVSFPGVLHLSAVLLNGASLGPRTESARDLLLRQEAGWSVRRYTNAEGGDEATVLIIHTGDTSSPRDPGRHYQVRYSLRRQPDAVRAVSLTWLIVPLALLGWWRGEGWRTVATLRDLKWQQRLALLVPVIYGLFALRAQLTRTRSLLLLGVLAAIALPLLPARARRGGGGPAVLAWVAALLGWAWVTLLLPGSHAVLGVVLGVTLASLVGGATAAALRGRLASHPAAAADWLYLTALGTAVAVLLANGRLGAAVGLPPNVWTVKFSLHVLLVLVWLALLAAVRSPHPGHAWRAGTLVGVLLLTELAGGSKSGLAAASVSLVAGGLALRWPCRSRRGLVAATLALILLAPWLAGMPWRLQQRLPPAWASASARYLEITVRGGVWEVSRRLIAERPWTGWGVGAGRNLPAGHTPVADLLAVPPERRTAGEEGHMGLPGGHPHSFPLLVWLELGLVGALLLAALVVALGRFIARFEAAAPLQAALLGTFAATVALFAVNYPAWHPMVHSLLWLGPAVAGALLPSAPRQPLTRLDEVGNEQDAEAGQPRHAVDRTLVEPAEQV